MARPKKNILKTEKITVRFTSLEKQSIVSKAVATGLTESEVIRQSVLGNELKQRATPEQFEVLKQISGVANNLNQIAKRINSGEFANIQVDDLIHKIRSILNKTL